MKALIDREQLLDAFGAVSAAVPSRTPKPVLMNVKLRATPEGSTLMATDLEVSIARRLLGVKADAPGEVLLPAARVLQILRACPDDDELLFEVEPDGSLLGIRGRRAAFRLPHEDPTLFPDPPADLPGPGLRVAPDALRLAIRRTTPFTDPDSTRYALAGVLFEPRPDDPTTLDVVATDGRRMAHQVVTVEPEAGATLETSPVVPAKALRLIERNLGDDAGDVVLHATGQGVAVRSGRSVIHCRLVEGRFPNWRAVLPKSFAHRVPFAEAGVLLAAAEQARVMTSKESRGIDLEFRPGDLAGRNLRLSATTADVGESGVDVPLDAGPDATLALSLDGAYLVEALKAIGDRTPTLMELIDRKSAVVLRADDGGGYEVVIMPLNRGE